MDTADIKLKIFESLQPKTNKPISSQFIEDITKLLECYLNNLDDKVSNINSYLVNKESKKEVQWKNNKWILFNRNFYSLRLAKKWIKINLNSLLVDYNFTPNVPIKYITIKGIINKEDHYGTTL